MEAFPKDDFQKLSLTRKYDCLKSGSDYVGARIYGSFHVHLFLYNGYYVEMWKKLGINVIHSIDVVRSQAILDTYLDNIDFKLP